jgi:hypothetical protein
MGGFIVVGLLVLAVVAAGWMRLRPSAAERARARMRQQAMGSGWRCRWLPPSEALVLGLAEGNWCWYWRTLDGAGCDGAWVRDGLNWRSMDGGLPPAWLDALPDGVGAVRLAGREFALAWDEREPGALDAAARCLPRAGQSARG